VKKEDAERFCSECGLTYFETSSKNNINVIGAFVDLSRKMRRQNPNIAPTQGTQTKTDADGCGCCNVA
jgi:hypothetical protein